MFRHARPNPLVSCLEQTLTYFSQDPDPLALHKDPINDCNPSGLWPTRILDYGVLATLLGIGVLAPGIVDLFFELIELCGYQIPLLQ